MESEWSLSQRVSACLYYVRRLVLGVVYSGETGLQRSEGHKAETFKNKLFRKWTERWLKQRYHDDIRTTLSQAMDPLSDGDRSDHGALSEACRDGLVASSFRAVSQWQTSEHESRWLRGLTPIIAKFAHLQSKARAVDPFDQTVEDAADASSRVDSIIREQHVAIASLLLSNYIEWLLFALIGDRALVWFMDECLNASDA
jgi:hypothetical protein